MCISRSPVRYQEFLPPRELSHAIECIWLLTPAAARSGLDRIYPDGASDIVNSGGNVTVCGPAPSFRVISGIAPLVGFRIRRGTARTVLGISPTELARGAVSLGALCGRRGEEFANRLAELCASEIQIAPLCGLLAEQIPGPRELDEAVLAVIERMDRSGEGHPMESLASGVGLSERQLRRRFENQVGLGVKHYARMIRFQHFLDAIRRNKRQLGAALPGWAALGCDHGFSDQAHLIREIKAFAGLTPAQLWLTV
jgi:AraC-like DNA-binding protein